MKVKDILAVYEIKEGSSIDIYNREGYDITGHSSREGWHYNVINTVYTVDNEVLNADVLSITPMYSGISLRVDMD